MAANNSGSVRRPAKAKRARVPKAQAVLDAAIAEFLDKGYEGANVRSILAASGASAGSVYRRFGSKEGLYREVVENRIDLSFPREVRLQPQDGPIAEQLTRFAHAYLRDFLDPAALSVYAMVIAEAENFPAETRRLWELGPMKAIEQVAQYLRHYQDQGDIEIDDATLAAAQFLDMIKGGLHVRRLLAGAGAAPTSSEIEASVTQAVRVFCKGIAAK